MSESFWLKFFIYTLLSIIGLALFALVFDTGNSSMRGMGGMGMGGMGGGVQSNFTSLLNAFLTFVLIVLILCFFIGIFVFTYQFIKKNFLISFENDSEEMESKRDSYVNQNKEVSQDVEDKKKVVKKPRRSPTKSKTNVTSKKEDDHSK